MTWAGCPQSIASDTSRPILLLIRVAGFNSGDASARAAVLEAEV
jgi:hypothetical protein